MDPLTFASNLVRDLAWPITSLVLVYLLVRHRAHLGKAIKSIRFGDTEITLREDWAAARDSATQAKLEGNAIGGEDFDVSDKVLRLAEIDPAVAIVAIWKSLEAELISLMQHNGLMRFTTPNKFMEQLARLGKITQNELDLFRRLTDIRNQSVHAYSGSSPTVAEVVEFKEFVELLIARLRKVKDEPGYIDVPRE